MSECSLHSAPRVHARDYSSSIDIHLLREIFELAKDVTAAEDAPSTRLRIEVVRADDQVRDPVDVAHRALSTV